MKQIRLGGQKGYGLAALVDDRDYKSLSEHAWNLAKNNYAVATINYRQVKMHRLIMGAEEGQHVDHINGNHLDNRRSNLRFCTAAQNSQNSYKPKTNTSGYKGVFWEKRKRRWVAKIVVNDRAIWLGYYRDRHLAAIHYNAAAKEYFGEFAKMNEIDLDKPCRVLSV